jgi:CRP/FNR family transcriptional regulator, cyclic AMP receptor protein
MLSDFARNRRPEEREGKLLEETPQVYSLSHADSFDAGERRARIFKSATSLTLLENVLDLYLHYLTMYVIVQFDSLEILMPSPRRLPRRKSLAPMGPGPFDPKAFLASVGAERTIHRYRPKEEIFSQGDRANAVFYVQQGRVKLGVLSKQGKEATIALLGPGDFLGEACLASDQSLRLATATAITDCSILKIEKKRMLRTLREEHEFSDLFVGYMVERHNRTQADLVDQLFNSSEKRLARALLILSRFGKKDKPESVIPPVSQETLAEMVGTTRQRVNFFMNKFKKLGFIKYDGGLEVNSSLLNVVLHE